MLKRLKFIPPLIVAAALVAITVILTVFESEYLWKVQELNLFLDTKAFFWQQMVVPAGMLTWLGTFFTQLFYIPWLGSITLCAWWALLAWIAVMAFRIPWKWMTLLLIPVALLLISDVFLGYWVYYIKLRGYFFVATIGMTAAVALVWLYRLIPSKYGLSTIFIVLATACAYPLLGVYGLLSAMLMAVISWRLSKNIVSKSIDTVVAVLCVVAVPLLFYRYVFYQTNIDYILTAGWPDFFFGKDYSIYYIPFYLLFAWAVVAAACYAPRNLCDDVRRPALWGTLQCLLLVAAVYATYTFWYKDSNFHKELRMQQAMEQCNWEGVLAEEKLQDDEPTRAIVMMRNLALSRLNRQGDEMYHYRVGSKKPTAPFPVKMIQVAGKSIYYNYGQINFCYRWCLEDGVEYGWRTEYLKYLAKCALVNGENQTARKYLELLKHTLFHKRWAEQQEKWVGNPDELRKDKDYAPILRMMGYQDQLTSDRAILEQYLYFEMVRIETDDPILQEQTLIGALWTKDIMTFWPRFFKYMELHPGQRIPTHYQEAAYLYETLEHHVDINAIPIDDVVKQTYANFITRVQQSGGAPESILKERLYPEFGHTFYYEYFLNRDQELY